MNKDDIIATVFILGIIGLFWLGWIFDDGASFKSAPPVEKQEIDYRPKNIDCRFNKLNEMHCSLKY